MSDYGRFRLGERVAVEVVISGVPDDNPVAVVMPSGGGGTAANQRMGYDKVAGVFRATIRLGATFGLGTYAVSVTYSIAGIASNIQSTFTVVGGGDQAGAVISLYAFDRPEARYVLAQLDGGKLVQGRNPKL